MRGNEIADSLAKSGSAREDIEQQLPAELMDEFPLIDSYILDQWQAQYNSSETGAAHRMLEPTVSSKLKFSAKCRNKETTISRFRLGKCRLNAYLYEIHRHPDGLCQSCQEAETIEHFLLRCKSYEIAEKLQNACAALALSQ